MAWLHAGVGEERGDPTQGYRRCTDSGGTEDGAGG